ncbi:L,D-transpeptidase family protein [Streptomyces sp. NPDC051784]|uniref:L,D-transpeptidase family protein n=1 Tax=Streptomyces sp. NPDC051784 TaxID=3155805 RepID=UPI0034340EB8
MRRVRKNRPSRGARTTAAAALGVFLLAALTTGCKVETAGTTGTGTAKPVTHLTQDAKDDGKPRGDRATPTAVPPPTPSARRSPEARTLMAAGDRGGRVRELQARLRQIGHFDRNPTGYYGTVTDASVRSFQGKRGLPRTGRTDAETWERLLAMTRKPTARELDPPTTLPVAKPDPRCLKGRVMCVSKSSRTLSWMIDGKVLMSMDVRFGSQYTPTREGTFSVFWKSRHHVSTLYDSPMPYAMFFSGGQAVHYSSDFAARGYSGASHGCVNVRDEGKIASLYGQVRKGDKVVVH